MANRRPYLLLTAFIVVIALLLAAFHGPPEPSYGGKKLSELLHGEPLPKGAWAQPVDSEVAVRQIGPQALPYLLRWMRCEEPAPWKFRFCERFKGVPWARRLAARLVGVEQWYRAGAAMRAFRALGTEGASAAGELTQMLNDPTHPDTGWRAAAALGGLGSVGAAPLTAAVTNQQLAMHVRSTAAGCLTYSSDGRAALRDLVTNSDPVVRNFATNVLRAQ